MAGWGVRAVKVGLLVPGGEFPVSSCPQSEHARLTPRTPGRDCLEKTRLPSTWAGASLPSPPLSLENRRAEQLGEAGQSLLGPRARGPVEDELALSPDQERLLLRGWVPRWSHQPPTAEAAADRVPPELTLQVTGRCLSDSKKK
ncbi:hypothetical protein J1605_001200 [Eschrichtius robustus]|uniref:Uncharacterized protein n=1 Tax=Eschrichtius robustus TaxID=9764 RepID=A0AB34GFY5_ESCRO|nr:hypothetical protein J1605_001200 [Eschrichtius robustus]